MAGTFTGKVLAEGQLPMTKGALYSVPGSTTAFVKVFRLLNTNAAQQSVNGYVNASGVSRRLWRAVLAQDESADFIDKDDAIVLQAGDIIEGDTTTGTAVDYVIMGAEET